ncbi:hypothetical protein [Nocardia fusca]|uniref:Uncharacterized protein n=1 Tax=Nocardia fusca TaxID=941183 RepID=A0ABV3FJY4_9NOCA
MPLPDDPSRPEPLRVLDEQDFPDPFAPVTDEARAARRACLLSRARTVRAHDWDDYRWTWSSGEVAAVALLLDDHAMLAECGEDRDSVLRRSAFDLYGRHGGPAEVAAGCSRTAAFFDKTADELTRGTG